MPSTITIDWDVAASVFHALSDPTRLEVLAALRDGERCVCELQDALNAAQSRLSFHLKVLREAGLVLDRREGRWMHYRLNPETLASLGETVHAIGVPGAAGTRTIRRVLGVLGECCG